MAVPRMAEIPSARMALLVSYSATSKLLTFRYCKTSSLTDSCFKETER